MIIYYQLKHIRTQFSFRRQKGGVKKNQITQLTGLL